MSHLNRLRISKDSHCRSEDTIETLIKVLSTRFRELLIREIVHGLTTESEGSNTGISIDVDALMFSGSKFEFGKHNGMYFNNSKSVLGLLMALSKALNLTIFVICGRMPLKVLHNNNRVLKFNFGEADSQKIVIGLVGLSIFHGLKQPEEDSETWNVMFRESMNITDDLLESLISESNRRLDIPASENIEREDHGPVETSVSLEVPSRDENVGTTSILDFINFHSTEIDEKRIEIDVSAYTSRERIGFESTSINEFRTEPISELNFLYDIDGFFAFHDWNDSAAFKGDVVLNYSPEFDCLKEERTFKQLLTSHRHQVVDNVVFFKIGLSTGIKNMIFDVCFSATISENDFLANSKILRGHASTAFTYGLDAPCYDIQSQTNLHPGCDCRTYRSVLDAHTNNLKRKNYSFSNSRYKCFAFHFIKKLHELCEKDQIVLESCFQYLQSVGSKSKLFSDTVNGLYNQIMVINSTVNLDKVCAYYDVAFSVIARTMDPGTKVN